MKQTIPRFYSSFACTASACTDSCCIGWEIDIDPKTACYYQQISQKENFPFGERLKSQISYDETPHFLLTEGDRCPFLNQQNLCDIYIHLGEEHLCEICAQHPRFHEWFGDYKESGLGLCCEEAARLLLSEKEPLSFTTSLIEEEPDTSPFDSLLLDQLLCLRQKLFSVMQDRSQPLSQRLSRLLLIAERAQEELDNRELPFTVSEEDPILQNCTDPIASLEHILSFLQTLEPIDPNWPHRLNNIQKGLPTLLKNREQFLSFIQERLYEYENLCVYFLYRYLLKAVWDEDILSRVKFSVFSAAMIFLLGLSDFSQKESYTLSEQILNTKAYSKEIEYCDENLEAVLEQSWNDEAFSIPVLADLIAFLFSSAQ